MRRPSRAACATSPTPRRCSPPTATRRASSAARATPTRRTSPTSRARSPHARPRPRASPRSRGGGAGCESVARMASELALTDLPAATRWKNWVGNQSFTPAYAAAPRDEDEVVALVRAAAERVTGVRVAAAVHSFTRVVETDGMVLDLAAMRGVVATDAARKRASALPGTLIRDFYEPLW